MTEKRIETCAKCGVKFDPWFEAPKRKIENRPTDMGNHLGETLVVVCPRCGADTEFTIRISPPIDVNTVN